MLDIETHKLAASGLVVAGICFIIWGSLGIAGIFHPPITITFLSVGPFFLLIGLAIYNAYQHLDHRFELGERSAEHQYGPFKIKAESLIEYPEESGEVLKNGVKTRTVNCKACTEDGEVITSESDTQIVGSRPTTAIGEVLFRFLKGDDRYIQSTEKHIKEVSLWVKDDAMEQIANGGNNPGIKAALEAEFGEEWYSEESIDTTDRSPSIHSQTERGADPVPKTIE
jgi:hypothetical protein